MNKDGAAPLQSPNGGFAIDVSGPGNTIGGTGPGEGNVIFATTTAIRLVERSGGQNFIQGNFIGTNATGTAGLGGYEFGIVVQTPSETITGNVISGGSVGIHVGLQSTPGPGPMIQGNMIGTNLSGTSAIPNDDGIIVSNAVDATASARIGGANLGEGNTIAFNNRYGVFVNSGQGVSILGNSIFANGNLGINLNGAPDGFFGPVTANDPGDGDTGANGLQNYSVITSAGSGIANTIVSGTFNSTPDTTFRLEFFTSSVTDPSGFGEGKTFLGFTNVTTNASGDASFNVGFNKAGGTVISATATDPAGNTSEFAQDVTASNIDVIIDASTPQSFLDSLTVIVGSLIMVDVAGRTDLNLPNLTEVDGDFVVTGNPDLAVLNTPLLTTVGGNVDISDNPALTSVNLGSLATASGSVSVNSNTAATSIDLGSLATASGSVSVNGNTAATSIDLGSLAIVGGDASVSGNTSMTSLSIGSAHGVGGSVTVSDNDSLPSLLLSNLIDVGGDFIVTTNSTLTMFNVPQLASVGGDTDVSQNQSMMTVDLGGFTSAGGSVNVSGNTAATGVDLSSLTSVGGTLSVSGNTAATGVNLDSLTSVSGGVSVSGNTSATGVDLSSLTSVGGTLSVSGNTSAAGVDLSSLTSVGGTLSVSGNTAATGVDLGSLTTVGGDASVSGNTSMTSLSIGSAHGVGGSVTVSDNDSLPSLLLPNLIDVGGDFIVTTNPLLSMFDVPQLASVGGDTDVSENQSMMTVDLSGFTNSGGDVNINGNTAADVIDLSSLTSLSGSVSINGNTAADVIDANSLTEVGGSVSINDNTSADVIDLSSLSSVGGDETLEAQDSVTAVTANGSTEVTLFSTEAQMTAALAVGTFADAVAFTVTRLDPATLPPEPGQDSTGTTTTIDPLSAYQFHFDIPTLGQQAALTFEINVSALSSSDHDAFLAALAAGNATVAVKNDAPGSEYQAFAVCQDGQTPDGGCITISQPDADHFVFQGVTGHFSTFAVVIVTPSGPTGNSPPVARDDAALLSTGTSINIAVLANDSDPDGDTLTVTSVTQPTDGHGSVTINANGTLTYTQTVLASGAETFTYTINDGHGGTTTATVAVTVNLSAKSGIDMLLAQVKSSSLRHGLQTSLIAKLNAAQKSLIKGNSRTAANQLTAFTNEVRTLKRTHILPLNLADLWLAEEANILASLPKAATEVCR